MKVNTRHNSGKTKTNLNHCWQLTICQHQLILRSTIRTRKVGVEASSIKARTNDLSVKVNLKNMQSNKYVRPWQPATMFWPAKNSRIFSKK